jgi:hypothetical protein
MPILLVNLPAMVQTIIYGVGIGMTEYVKTVSDAV